MSTKEIILTIVILAFATQLTRWIAFIIFDKASDTPKYIKYLGKALPPAIFAMLVVYCLKDINFISESHGLPEILSIILVVLIHLWRRNMLLSILAGTVCYMLLIQFIFI